MFISWFIIASIVIFTMNDEWVFLLFVTFLSQTIFKIFRFSWSFALFFISFLMTFFWLFMLIVMHISYVSTAKIHCDMHVKFTISFKSFSDLLVHLSWLHEERCLHYSACKETWSDFVDLLTHLSFSEESAWWSSSASSLFLLCLLFLSWLCISCKVMMILLWNITFSLIILLLSCLLMTWFSMRDTYFFAFVTVCLAVELMFSISAHSSWWMHSELYDVFLLNRVEDDASASMLFLFMSNLCSSLSLMLMSLLVNQ